MSQATLRVPAAADQARTARLVASTAARRAGIDEDQLDDVRLAVGEAVALSVHRAEQADESGEITVVMTDTTDRFSVSVVDDFPGSAAPDLEEMDLSLQIIRALAPESEIGQNDAGAQTVVLSWPVST
jgi:anti-sigma regulatory factor (Ser/Thr protein kinase)